MTRLTISTHNGFGDCDDCGMYECGHFEAVLGTGRKLSGSHDGHLGGGNWQGDLATVLLWALQALGYRVQVDGVEMVPMPYYTRDTGQWVQEELLPSGSSVLDIRTEAVRDADYPEYPYYTRIELPALPGEPAAVMTYVPPDADGLNAGWEGDWASVLQKLLEQRVDLALTVTRED